MNTEIVFLGKTKRDSWECFHWQLRAKDQTIDYYTGLGHVIKAKHKMVEDRPKKPKLRDILYSLASDASCGERSFQDFCAELGYSEDSIKALDTYLKCQRNGQILEKICKSYNATERILAWEL